ncbi:HypC/HybG/HupF family hydrogenase formation chaperone [Moorella naiadis]|uniref:HypC/HybG/HupF family hydrogenase formation chaperone n=1 Tax=Moorella naiadis (nom. illeg.) TaxID=3093670 RepID=UPI003D9CB7CA
MCLGVPARIIFIDGDGRQATVDYQGVQVTVNLALVEGCQLGNYVLVHAGHAISVIDTEEAEARLSLWRELIEVREEQLADGSMASRSS